MQTRYAREDIANYEAHEKSATKPCRATNAAPLRNVERGIGMEEEEQEGKGEDREDGSKRERNIGEGNDAMRFARAAAACDRR
eukprot:7939015-Pyramimonas_sp.AAC.1